MKKNEIKRIGLTEPEEIKAALDLVWQVFLEFEAPEYPDEGIAQFKGFIDYVFFTKRMEEGGIVLWGCYRNEVLIGVAAVRNNNHISLLFVDPACHRQGIGSALLCTMLAYCRSHSAFSVVTVNSSPYGALFYKYHQFEEVRGEQITDGIRYIPMKIYIQPKIPGLEA